MPVACCSLRCSTTLPFGSDGCPEAVKLIVCCSWAVAARFLVTSLCLLLKSGWSCDCAPSVSSCLIVFAVVIAQRSLDAQQNLCTPTDQPLLIQELLSSFFRERKWAARFERSIQIGLWPASCVKTHSESSKTNHHARFTEGTRTQSYSCTTFLNQ